MLFSHTAIRFFRAIRRSMLCMTIAAACACFLNTGCPYGDDDGESYEIPDYDYEPPDPNDLDYDGVSLESDNCGNRYNPDQTDSDGDGRGDECDNCSLVENPGQEDRDVDSYGDACDECPDDPSKIAEGTCGCGTPDLDLNGDGIPDCEGVPTFAERIIGDNQLSQVADLELVDLDNDGNPDVIAALSNTDAVYGYLNQGGGQGWIRIAIAPALTVLAVDLAIADIDGDGDMDVAVAELFDRFVGPASPGQVVWYRHPAGTQGAWERIDVTDQTLWGARSIAAADFNNDGMVDLVVSSATVQDADGNEQGNGVVVIENLDDGDQWGEPLAIDAALLDAVTVITHDIDGDGMADVIAAGFEDNDIYWYRNDTADGALTFEGFTTGLTPAPYDLAIAEGGFGYTNGITIVTTAGDFNNGLQLDYQTPLGSLTESWVRWTVASDFPGGDRGRVAPVDFNGDGVMDVAASSQSDTIRVFLGAANGTWTSVDVATGYTGLNDLATGDINGDGVPDVVACTSERPGGDRVSWWPNE